MKKILFLISILFVLKSSLFSAVTYFFTTYFEPGWTSGGYRETPEGVRFVQLDTVQYNYYIGYNDQLKGHFLFGKYNGNNAYYIYEGYNYSTARVAALYTFLVTTPNTCVLPEVLDEETNTCYVPPPPDEDLDGTPDKCDFDHPDFDTLDCDGDTIPNGQDFDIDGDNISNDSDFDSNNNGVSDSQEEGSAQYDTSCQGVNLNSSVIGTLAFPLIEYKFYANYDSYRCSNLIFSNALIDATFTAPDKNDACSKPYCYVHYVKDRCDFDISWYRPGTNWEYFAGLSELECNLKVDDINYISNSYIIPDDLNCPNVSFCFLQRKENLEIEGDKPDSKSNSENNDSTMEAPDLNSTSSDLAPLLQASNTTNKHLDDLKDKTDLTNNKLEDLKGLSTDLLNTNKSSLSTLKDLKSSFDTSLSYQADSLSSLNNLNSINKKMSDTITNNQGVISGSLDSIDSKMTTNNDLLTDIKNSVVGDGSVPDTSSYAGFEDSLTSYDSFLTSIGEEYSIFKTNVENSLSSIETQYNNTKASLENPFSPVILSSGSTDCISFNFHGSTISIDYSILSVFYPYVNFITTVFFMFFVLKFSLTHILKGLE